MRHVSVLVLLAACSGGKTPTDDDTTPTFDTAEACVDDDDCADGFVCGDRDVCVPGDRDNSFEEANTLRFNDRKRGMIFPPGDVDYYAFETQSPGQWVSVQTINERRVSDDLDTVVTILRSNGLEHAVQDDLDVYTISGFDSRVIAWLPEAGTWYVKVEDVSSWPPAGFASPRDLAKDDYELEVVPFTAVTTEAGPLAVELTSGTSIASRGVLLETPGDVDTLELDVPNDDVVVEISGGTGIPGSQLIPRIEVSRDGAPVAVQTDLGDGRYAMVLRGAEGTYTIDVSDATGGGSQNHWLVLYMRTYEPGASVTFWGTTAYDMETEPNDDRASASASTLVDLESGTLEYVGNFFEGTIDAVGDEDWYVFRVPPALPFVTVRCYADRFGSIADLAIDLVDADGNVLESATDNGPYTAPFLYNYEADGDTDVYVKVTAEDDLAGPAAFYRCQVFRTDVAVDEN